MIGVLKKCPNLSESAKKAPGQECPGHRTHVSQWGGHSCPPIKTTVRQLPQHSLSVRGSKLRFPQGADAPVRQSKRQRANFFSTPMISRSSRGSKTNTAATDSPEGSHCQP